MYLKEEELDKQDGREKNGMGRKCNITRCYWYKLQNRQLVISTLSSSSSSSRCCSILLLPDWNQLQCCKTWWWWLGGWWWDLHSQQQLQKGQLVLPSKCMSHLRVPHHSHTSRGTASGQLDWSRGQRCRSSRMCAWWSWVPQSRNSSPPHCMQHSRCFRIPDPVHIQPPPYLFVWTSLSGTLSLWTLIQKEWWMGCCATGRKKREGIPIRSQTFCGDSWESLVGRSWSTRL